MAYLLIKQNHHGLESFKVAESFDNCLSLLGSASKSGGFATFHRDGGLIALNCLFVAYILPDQEMAPLPVDENPPEVADNGTPQ